MAGRVPRRPADANEVEERIQHDAAQHANPGGSRHRGVRPVRPDRRSDRADGGAGRRQAGDAAASRPAGKTGARPPAAAGEPPQPRRQSTAAGRASTTCRAAARSSSISRRWRAGTSRRTWSRSAPCRIAPRPATSRRSARSSSKRTRGVASTERLVSFQKMKIVEANFQTLPKEQVRESSTEIDKAIPDDERVIALDRVLANLDKSQIVPKNVEGVKADPPAIFFSKTPAVIVNLDGEPIWSPIKENDLKFAVNTNWDLFQHAPDQHAVPSQQRHVAEGDRREGPVDAGGHAARQLQEAAGGRQLEGRQGQPAGQAGRRIGVPKVFVSTQPAELILLTGEPEYRPVQGTGLLWVSNTESDVFRHGQDRRRLLPGRRPLVLGAGLHRTVDVRDAVAAGGLQEDSARARAIARPRVGAREPIRRPKPCSLAQIPQTARVNKKELKAPDVAFQGDPRVHADREDDGRARGEHRQGRVQGRRPVLHVLPGRVVRRQERHRARGKSPRSVPQADLPDSRQLALASRHLRHRRRRR